MACVPLEVDGINANGDGSFRYEWGTWCSRDKLDVLSNAMGEIRLYAGAYTDLLLDKPMGRRMRIASGKYWDVILHVLPKSRRMQHKWPEGSWTLLQPLTGVIEVSQLRGPDADGYYVATRPRDLRGGGDGSGTIGSGGGGFGGAGADDVEYDAAIADGDGGVDGRRYSTSAGEGSCIKLLGGPLRRYTGKAMSGSTILEVNVRPPVEANVDAAMLRYGDAENDDGDDGDYIELEELDWEGIRSVLARVLRKTKVVEEMVEEEQQKEEAVVALVKDDIVKGSNEGSSLTTSSTSGRSGGLNKKLGMEFENVGGLDSQLDDIAVSDRDRSHSFLSLPRDLITFWLITPPSFPVLSSLLRPNVQRRVLASRANPAAARRLGVSHVRGILLSGPPGCGKVRRGVSTSFLR